MHLQFQVETNKADVPVTFVSCIREILGSNRDISYPEIAGFISHCGEEYEGRYKLPRMPSEQRATSLIRSAILTHFTFQSPPPSPLISVSVQCISHFTRFRITRWFVWSQPPHTMGVICIKFVCYEVGSSRNQLFQFCFFYIVVYSAIY
jgi:hypothetical protein